jgi:murein DD-endopeptidase MepM/ murein hydrolase activator NlpD
MDGIFSATRRYRKSLRNTKTLAGTILKQAIICVVIFALLFALISINVPDTNYLADKIKYVLAIDYDLDSIIKIFGSGTPAIRDDAEESETKQLGFETDMDTGATAVEGTWIVNTESWSEESGKYSFIAPVNGILLSKFGEVTYPFDGTPTFNEGIDIETRNGENVKAVLEGTVADTGSSALFGKFIKIKHDNGMYTLYANCSELFLSKGQKVVQGDIIGRVGDTAGGRSYLHIEIHQNGIAIDPLKYINIPLQ